MAYSNRGWLPSNRTSDTYLISEKSVEAIGISSRVATDDKNGNVWLFGISAPKLSQLFPEVKSLSRNYRAVENYPNICNMR